MTTGAGGRMTDTCRHCQQPIEWRRYAFAERLEHANGFARCIGSKTTAELGGDDCV